MTVDSPTLVEINSVSKRFVLRKDNSLKERIVNFRRGSKHKEDFWALRDVSIEIKAGTTVGLIGHNGSGKSTLLKVIGGIVDASSGSVQRRGRMAALLELGAGFHPDLTGRENVFLNATILGLSQEETEERFDDIWTFSGIGEFIDTQVKFYSSGMYVRLAFAVAVHTDPDILLVDEVLAVGDEAFQLKCMNKIKSFQAEGRTIVLVTHNLGQVTELCDHAVLLNQGELIFQGDPREAVARFRDVLEERRIDEDEQQQERNSFHVVPRPRPTCTIEAFACPGGDAQGNDNLSPGDDLNIKIHLDSSTQIDDWICAIQIDNTQGQAVYGTRTDSLDVLLTPLIGQRSVQFSLTDCQFGEGKFFVNVSILDSQGQHLFDAPQSCSFDTVAPRNARGSIYIRPAFFEISTKS